jgi:flagellin-like protein
MVKKVARRAVSPVLATLMMVAVAVALSVIIFTWSQGFLSQTGEAASGQQAAQNIAAQSGILIESVTFNTTSKTATVYVRNVGTVSVTPANYTYTLKTATGTTSAGGNTGLSTLSPGQQRSFEINGLSLSSGDVFTVKVTTDKGTFAQATYIVP